MLAGSAPDSACDSPGFVEASAVCGALSLDFRAVRPGAGGGHRVPGNVFQHDAPGRGTARSHGVSPPGMKCTAGTHRRGVSMTHGRACGRCLAASLANSPPEPRSRDQWGRWGHRPRIGGSNLLANPIMRPITNHSQMGSPKTTSGPPLLFVTGLGSSAWQRLQMVASFEFNVPQLGQYKRTSPLRCRRISGIIPARAGSPPFPFLYISTRYARRQASWEPAALLLPSQGQLLGRYRWPV